MNLHRQLVAYAGIGGLQWLLDSAVMITASHAGLAVALATIAGRLCGAVLGYWLNGRYTFANRQRDTVNTSSLGRFVRFWLLATVLSALVLGAIDRHFGLTASWLFKPLVDFGFAAFGFWASRHWIYPRDRADTGANPPPGDGPHAG